MNETALIDEMAVQCGQDLGELMHRAGVALADEAANLAEDGPVLVATGPGNNGGDGWVCARVLAERGAEVIVWPVIEAKSPLCRTAAERARPLVTIVDEPPRMQPGLIVDAILGAGASGPLREPVPDALHVLAGYRVPVLAADVPTGLGGEHLILGCHTVCFQLAKAELLLDPRVGEFKTVDIGIDPVAWQEIHANVLRRFPPLHRSGHKGSHGELLVVGGGVFPGALELSCRAALRTGCDQVRAFTSDGPDLPPSLIVHRQRGRSLAPDDPSHIGALLARAAAVLIGPGIGREPGGPEAAQQAFSLAIDMGVPVIVDADGISALGPELRQLPVSSVPVVITPHRGEARNLLGRETDEATVHRFARPDRVILLKGRVDFITNGRRWQRNPRGNPRMAVGGTGDCLAGLTAGFIARGATPFDAARLAAFWLTTTADELWQELGPCYLPEDVIDHLPSVLKRELTALDFWPPVVD